MGRAGAVRRASRRVAATGVRVPADRRADRRLLNLPASLLTASLAHDFVGIARRGEWIEDRCDFDRLGRDLAFASCCLTSGAKAVGRASGVFKVMAGL